MGSIRFGVLDVSVIRVMCCVLQVTSMLCWFNDRRGQRRARARDNDYGAGCRLCSP